MLKNYLKIAYRGLLKNKGASTINISGLAIGMASCILIFIYVNNELSYDQFHEKSDRIFRLYTIDKALGVSSNKVGITMSMMAPTAKEEIPEVENSVRVSTQSRGLITLEDKNFYADNLAYVEKEFFEIFDFKLKIGEAGKVLSKPRTAVLSETMAEKTFGKGIDPMGKTFTLDNDNEWEVVGIMEDIKENSHLEVELLLSLYPLEEDSNTVQWLNNWRGLGMISYAVLDDPSSEKTVEAKMQELALQHEVPEMWIPQLQPLKDVHLKSSDILFDGYNANKSDIVYLYSLSAVALFVILIASFNFMNLATAKSSTRAKEVGLRKVVGARKHSLILQHLSESVFLCFISLLVALGLVALVESFIEIPINDEIILYIFGNTNLLISIILGTFLLGLFAGLYPAFILSRFQPIKILRGKFQSSKGGIWLRKLLVITQFTASITMIIGTVMVYQQLSYIKNKELGFNKEQVVTFRLGDPELRNHYTTFKDKLLQSNAIESLSSSSGMPGRTYGRTGILPEGSSDEDRWIVSVTTFDESYLDMMNIELKEGRSFSLTSGTDEQEGVIVNEALIQQIGWEEGVGKKLLMGRNNERERTIIGVVKDFHFASMRHSIEPLIMFYQPGANGNISVKLKGDNIQETMTSLEQIWKEIYPNHHFEYEFFDQEFNQLYRSDETFSSLIINFTWLAIFIACLGLFGLASYTAEQRTKEIGVRKVLGSSISQIVVLLSKEFVKLIIIANLIAWPLAFYTMNVWLRDFQYKIDLLSVSSISIFISSGLLALLIALFTVSYQAVSAALVNPVQSLKDE